MGTGMHGNEYVADTWGTCILHMLTTSPCVKHSNYSVPTIPPAPFGVNLHPDKNNPNVFCHCPIGLRNHLMVNNVPKKGVHEGKGRVDVLKQEDGWRELVAEAKGWLTKKIAESTQLETKDVEAALAALRTIARAEVKKTGKFVIPQLATLTLKRKPAQKAGTKVTFRKNVKVAAKLAAEAACAQAAWDATKRQLELRQQRLKLEQDLSHSQRQLLELRQKQQRQLESRRQQLLQQQRQPEQLEPIPTPPLPPVLQIPTPPRYPPPPHMVLLRIYRTYDSMVEQRFGGCISCTINNASDRAAFFGGAVTHASGLRASNHASARAVFFGRDIF